MQTTTPARIRTDFVRQIAAIQPSHPEHQTSRFRPVSSAALTKSAELRNFHIDFPTPARPVDNGIWGSGVGHSIGMRVWVSYGKLAPEDDDSIITVDGGQIWQALQRRYDPALTGLISVEPDGEWVDGDDGDADGRRWGYFTFDVQFLLDV